MACRSCTPSFNIYYPLRWHGSLTVEPVVSWRTILSMQLCVACSATELRMWVEISSLHMLIWKSRGQKMAAANSVWKEFVTSFFHMDLHFRNLNSLTIDSPEICAPSSTVAVSLTNVPCDTHGFAVHTCKKALFTVQLSWVPDFYVTTFVQRLLLVGNVIKMSLKHQL